VVPVIEMILMIDITVEEMMIMSVIVMVMVLCTMTMEDVAMIMAPLAEEDPMTHMIDTMATVDDLALAHDHDLQEDIMAAAEVLVIDLLLEVEVLQETVTHMLKEVLPQDMVLLEVMLHNRWVCQ
jgi:hypothetical protein